jgi:hypothetical protein
MGLWSSGHAEIVTRWRFNIGSKECALGVLSQYFTGEMNRAGESQCTSSDFNFSPNYSHAFRMFKLGLYS